MKNFEVLLVTTDARRLRLDFSRIPAIGERLSWKDPNTGVQNVGFVHEIDESKTPIVITLSASATRKIGFTP